MKVVSVNVGQPRDVPWRGQTIRTSIWKYPVAGRVFAGRLNLAGDAQADLVAHGGEHRAVMVYQTGSYQYWSDQLHRNDLTYGQFGENLTVEGLADDDVCIGDRFRIGGAIFEITQPRVTCYKVGLRMQMPEMPALLVSHKRPGFYFRVIQEGEIGAGDLIEKIADGPERMTVAEIDSLLYSSHHPADQLQRALRISALSNGWRGSLRELLDAVNAGIQAGNAGLSVIAAHPTAWTGFRRLRILHATVESEGVRSFELVSEDGTALPDWLPGQHLAVKVNLPSSSSPSIRMYSLSGPAGTGRYRIAVKREQAGGVSGYLHQQMKEGDSIESSAPRGTFTLSGSTAPLVLLSAGIGITPILAMLHAAVQAGKTSSREVWWIHSAQDAAHSSFAEEVRHLIAGNGSIHCIRAFSRPTTIEELGRDYEIRGHIDLATLKDLGVPMSGDFYLCGPEGYLKTLTQDLRTWGVSESNVHFEAFGPATSPSTQGGPAPHLPAENTGTGPLVTFARSGISLRWNPHFHSLLEAAEACDVPVQWSCRTGVCHRCESGLIDGQLEYSPTPLDPPAPGNALICCSVPLSAVELDL